MDAVLVVGSCWIFRRMPEAYVNIGRVGKGPGNYDKIIGRVGKGKLQLFHSKGSNEKKIVIVR